MALKETTKEMKHLLEQIQHDLNKAENGNKAASQRVRTGTVRLEKIAKAYRKESIRNEKTQTKSSQKTSAKKKSAAKPHKITHKPAAKHKARTAVKHAKPATRAKATHKKTVAKARTFSLKRPTAKIPARKY